MTPNSFISNIGIGATTELSLRVSVAILVRVLFENRKNSELMLALERRATLLKNENGHFVDVKSQPFGGAIRIHDLKALQDLAGDFHFDSEQSRSEQDFRIFIRPSAWETVREACLEYFRNSNNPVLESDPRRELAEEFAEALNINLTTNQFSYQPVGTIIENTPSNTEYIFARGFQSARIYRIFEAHILDFSLAHLMMTNSQKYSNEELQKLALEDAQNGGRGWFNSVLMLPLDQVHATYAAISPQARNRPVFFENHQLDETVAAVLGGVLVPKYQRV